MEKTSIENLGLAGDTNNWTTEKQERQQTFDKINKMKDFAFQKALEERRKREAASMPEEFAKKMQNN